MLSATTLVLAAILSLVAGTVCALTGWRVLARSPDEDRAATLAYVAFWALVGLVHALQTLVDLAGAVGLAGPALVVGVTHARLALLLFAFFGLCYHLLVVYTGRGALFLPLLGFYALTFVLIETWVAWAHPLGPQVETWRVAVAFEREPAGPLYGAVVLAVFLPPMLAACSYAMLLRRARSGLQRRRILLTSTAFGLYFIGLIAGYANVAWPTWGLLERVLGVGAGLGVLLAQRDPATRPPSGAEDALARRIAALV